MMMMTGTRYVRIILFFTICWCNIYEIGAQFNIRVGFHRDDNPATSAYHAEAKNSRWTTTLSPTVDYWHLLTHNTNGQYSQTSTRPIPKKSRFKQWMHNLTQNYYDKYQDPKRHLKQPVVITVSMMIIRVHSLSDSAMEFGIEMYYRERWNDHRLQFDPADYEGATELNLPIVVVNHVWKPDTYFLNAISAEVDSENSLTHRAFFRLSPNGDINYSRKISLKADCPMDLTMYPFDVQQCRLKLGSYGYLSHELTYKWVQRERGRDIEFKDRIDLAEFYAEGYKTSSKKVNYTTGSFDSLELCLTFKRRAGFCIMQVFFPATAVVMSSWVALWLAEDTTFSDVLAVILAIIFLAYAYNSVMPRVSYVKLLDLYMCSCFLFVFLSLAKLVVIKYFCHKWAKQNNRSYDFFMDQMLGMNAASSALDLEQQSASTSSRHSSVSLPKEEKTKPAKCAGKNKNGVGLNQNGVIRKEKGCLAPAMRRSRQAPPQSNRNEMDTASNDNQDDDYHSAVYVSNEETNENFKNEEIEASFVIDCDETKLEQRNGGKQENTPSTLAPLFGTTDGNMANSDSARRVTFFGMEAFAAWFDHKRRKKTGAARCMKYLRYFHVFTQLALPAAFASFFVFLLLIYPNVPRSNHC